MKRVPDKSITIITLKRYCSKCKALKDVQGGKWEVVNKGKNRKWVCSKHTAGGQ